jgi:RNA polymerase sigma factor (sigma-70 family)
MEFARCGSVRAFDQLYRQHVAAAYNLARQLARCEADADDLVGEAFSRVFNALHDERGPDTAFRAYLLTALRHYFIDKYRRDRKLELTNDVATVKGVRPEKISEQFSDTALVELERSLARRAFEFLPERWQAVLWFTEVKGHSPAEVAPILGLTANGVAALAYRAREGLREAYLRAHLATSATEECRAIRADLGAWTRSGLAKRRAAAVDEHLGRCADCQRQAAEIAAVNDEQLWAA